MSRNPPTGFCVLILVLFVVGCSSTSSAPHAANPVTFNIQVDNTRIDSGSQGANDTQDVTVVSDRRLYYKVVSPVDVTVYFYGVEAPGERMFLGQMQGREFTSSITPNTNTLEFVFVATQPNSSGTLKFMLSVQPFAPVAAE